MVGISTKKLLHDADVWIWAYQGELERSEFVHFRLEDAAFLCLSISCLDGLNVDKVSLQLLQAVLKGFVLAIECTSANHV